MCKKCGNDIFCYCGQHNTNSGDVSSSAAPACYAPGALVVVQDTPLEIHRPNTATILSGPDDENNYWIEMSTGVQWSCPSYRLVGA